MQLTDPQRLKFRLLAEGLSVTPSARAAIRAANGDQPLSSADFASTTGIILKLEDQVWVNAPISDFNPNFVARSPYALDLTSDGLVVSGDGLSSKASSWLPPAYHDKVASDGRPFVHRVVTHGDRARLSPIHGCGMACTFCDVPYGVKYGLKEVPAMLEAVAEAVTDPIQPARHLLISGGTPRTADVPWLREVYRSILTNFPDLDVDIMMVPVENLLDLEELASLGVHQLSINLELFSEAAARRYMPQKLRQGADHYLRFIERAAERMGPGRVRSMLMVGLEPMDATLSGVRAIAERGGVPVLSPFRPDPTTPLRNFPPPTADFLERVFLEASDIALHVGIELGPSCVPCGHNTLTLADPRADAAAMSHVPRLAY